MSMATIHYPLTQVDAVFEGGGCLGGAYVGALRCLRDKGYWFQRVAGSSAGAIIASLIAVGYTPEEFEWLMRDDVTSRPAALPPEEHISKIYFDSFLDAPLDAKDIPLNLRRNNVLWLTISGEVISQLTAEFKQQVNALKSELTNLIGAVLEGYDNLLKPDVLNKKLDDLVRKALLTQLRFNKLVDPVMRQMRSSISATANFVIGQIKSGVKSTSALTRKIISQLTQAFMAVLNTVFASIDKQRMALADAIILEIINAYPLLRIYINFVGLKRLFKGDAFLAKMRQLMQAKALQRKLITDIRQPVTFGVLNKANADKIELYITATDSSKPAKDGLSHIVYSSRDAGSVNKEVAVAVRESMSIPIVFEPCQNKEGKRTIVDGGLTSNLPLHLFLDPANNSKQDNSRQILIFTLTEGGENDNTALALRAAPTGKPFIDIFLRKLLGRSLNRIEQAALNKLNSEGSLLDMPLAALNQLPERLNPVVAITSSIEFRTIIYILDIVQRALSRGVYGMDATVMQHLLDSHSRITPINIKTGAFDWLNFELNRNSDASKIIASYGWAWTHQAISKNGPVKAALLDRIPSTTEIEFDKKYNALINAISKLKKSAPNNSIPQEKLDELAELKQRYHRDLDANPFQAKPIKPKKKKIINKKIFIIDEQFALDPGNLKRI
ncbi:patatin-like phospholipase family protein [Rheinheimera baltica]|uniref:patatin-like phospholipase family protein n=1 Tax=Rheinheimera baltica TaxID=67576 RepID=UPI00048990D6|nr:patatin-like phospholipase family protein [Rheinheimera baltica]